MSTSSTPFLRLVQALKHQKKTCTVVESCCGGLINASIMTVPGSSAVFYGGSVAYNTKRAKKLLLNDEQLHSKLVKGPDNPSPQQSGATVILSEAEKYMQSKEYWTAQAALAFCDQLNVDYAIAEGGASGPTFRPQGLTKGFSVIAIAGRDSNGKPQLLAQTTIRSTHADRELNMRLFADAAANLALETIVGKDRIQDNGEQYEKESVSDGYEETVWLDRATHLRTDENALKELDNRPDAKHVVLRGNDCLFSTDGSELALVTDMPSEFPKTFLGLEHQTGVPIFSVVLDENDVSSFILPPGAYFDNTRTHAPLLFPKDYELVLYATALDRWKQTHKFCSTCGNPLSPIQGGTCLECTSCKTPWWPRQDPSIICLITNRQGDKALLARSQRHPRKVHTALAGFVEAGETFEKAVMREAFEETGVRVDPKSIQYLSSQPWPFPRSCMIGFRATADDTLPLNIDANELVSAEWFDKAEVTAAAKVRGAVMNKDVAEQALASDTSLKVLVPPKGVLARSLIDNWLEDN